jgi:trimethylamine:corrinoid methyltransferase-like protein
MLKGFLRAIQPDQMERLHRGTLQVLQRTGLQMQGEFLLRALANAGCRVDFAARRAWFKPDLDINEAIYKFHRGLEVNADTCAVDSIEDLLFCERQTYLESEHTRAYFREVGWNPRLF